jgi:hypothetical protein
MNRRYQLGIVSLDPSLCYYIIYQIYDELMTYNSQRNHYNIKACN